MRTGIALKVTTLVAWLPSSILEMPRRPWEAMTIRSQPLSLAVSRIPSAGYLSLLCMVVQATPILLAVCVTPQRIRLADVATASS